MSHRTGWLLTALIALTLVAFKATVLNLPCYWDESFPYSLAVRHQVDNGLSLLPNGMPEHLSTGHPPLFYFLQALWMKVFGTQFWVARIWPLLLSVLGLLALYRLAVRHFTAEAGVVAVALTASYAAFFVQSSFMLPETLLALLVLLSLDAWLRQKWWQYLVFAALAVLTKEIAVMYILAMCAGELLRWWWSGKRTWKTLLRNGFVSGAPGLAGVVYFVIQRVQMGWFLFPRHVNAAGFDASRFWHQFFEGYGSQIMVFQGHLLFTVLAVMGLVWLLWKKRDAWREKRPAVAVMLLVLLFLVAFSAINFYNSARYILCLYPIWFLLVSWLTLQLWEKVRVAKWGSVAIMVGLHLFYLITIRGNGDTQPGYVHRVRAHRQGAQWLVEHGYEGRPLLSHFLMGWQLTSAAPGYVPAGSELVPAQRDDPDAVIVLTDHEPDVHGYRAICGRLLVRFEEGPAWIEIWERKPEP